MIQKLFFVKVLKNILTQFKKVKVLKTIKKTIIIWAKCIKVKTNM